MNFKLKTGLAGLQYFRNILTFLSASLNSNKVLFTVGSIGYLLKEVTGQVVKTVKREKH